MHFKLDTGAECNILPLCLLKKSVNKPTIENSTSRLIGFGGAEIPIKGMIDLKCRVRGHDHVLSFFVAEMDDMPILGLRTALNLGIISFSEE